MTPNINLLPRENKIYFILTNILIIILLLSWPCALYKQLLQTKQEIFVIQKQIINLKKKTISKSFIKNIPNNNNIDQQQINIINIFNSLHKNIINNIQLTQLTITNNSTKIYGQSESIFGITQLIKNMNTSHLQKISRLKDEYIFEISI